MTNRNLLVALFSFVIIACSQASKTTESISDAPYTVARYADYVATTGCDADATNYNRALQIAINHLVFNEDHAPDDELLPPNNDDVLYTRRHSRDFFGPLLDGSLGDGCLTPGLRRIVNDLGFPEDDSELLPPNAIEPAASFQIMSRPAYMASTECLASPATWHKYHQAFFEVVLGYDGSGEYSANMKVFLQELGEGRRTEDGRLDSQCLVPAVSLVADDLGLLNEAGEFALD